MSTTTTIDELAEMIAKGFAGVDKRFDQLDAKVDDIRDGLIADHERRLARIEEALAIPSRR